METFLFHCVRQQMVSAASPPTGHKLIMLSSSLADSWEESRQPRLSWNCRNRSDFFCNAITLISISQVDKHCYHLDALQIHSCEHILSVRGDICETWICLLRENRWDSLNLHLYTEGRLLPCQLLFRHTDRRRTSADYCPHFTKFSPVSTCMNVLIYMYE